MKKMNRPILLVAHPRSCSTAFERMFLTQHAKITCVHEPFCDPYHYGPERLSERHPNENERLASGLSEITYGMALSIIESAYVEGKRIFIKDMAKSLIPPDGKPGVIAQSVISPDKVSSLPLDLTQGTEPLNPTVLPRHILNKFHFTFLIRHPRFSIPSLYKISTPPNSNITGWHGFHPQDAGYDELHRLFDYLRQVGQIGPDIAGEKRPGTASGPQVGDGNSLAEICVVDADTLLDRPEETCKAYCSSVGYDFHPSMMTWNTVEDHRRAELAFQKSLPEHDVALSSNSIISRRQLHELVSDDEEYAEWTRTFGEGGARIIQDNVNANIHHYEYLKQFAMKV